MVRWALGILAIFSLFSAVLAQPAMSDSVPAARAETLYVIPAGPVAGSFTPAARLAIDDTIAGWARVRVEGWVPVAAVLDRMTQSHADSSAFQLQSAVPANKDDRPQCAAITKKGTRCSRKAKPGSKYCWQHQPH